MRRNDPNLVLSDECFPVVLEEVKPHELKMSLSDDEETKQVLNLSSELSKCDLAFSDVDQKDE